MTWYENIQQLFIQRYAPLLEWAFKSVWEYSVDLFTRYKMYMIWDSVVTIVICLFVLVWIYIACRKRYTYTKNNNWYSSNGPETRGPIILMSMFWILIPLLFLIHEITSLPKKILIPEVYIYQDLTSNKTK